jgi:hypothetical protein
LTSYPGLDDAVEVDSEMGRFLVFGVPRKGNFNFVPGIRNPALRGVDRVERFVSGLSRLSRVSSSSASDDEVEYRFSRSNLTPMAVRADVVLLTDPDRFKGAMDDLSEDCRADIL